MVSLSSQGTAKKTDRTTMMSMSTQNDLNAISERIRASFIAKTAARDAAVTISRELIRFCSMAIRASHRDEWQEAERLVGEAVRVAADLTARLVHIIIIQEIFILVCDGGIGHPPFKIHGRRQIPRGGLDDLL